MATYSKPTIRVSVLTLKEKSIVFSDGKDAYEAFEHKRTLKGETENGTVYVPFHAVQIFSSGIATEEATKADAYCE